MVIGYLRVSTTKQDLKNQRSQILEFSNSHKLGNIEFIEVELSSKKSKKDRKIDELFEKLKPNDVVIVSELSRLGRSLQEVISITNHLSDNNVRLICIKEGIDFTKRTMATKIQMTLFSLMAEIERDLISERTKSALARLKSEGVKLGRPKGSGSSKLDKFKDQIEELRGKQISKASISKLIEVPYSTLINYMNKVSIN